MKVEKPMLQPVVPRFNPFYIDYQQYLKLQYKNYTEAMIQQSKEVT